MSEYGWVSVVALTCPAAAPTCVAGSGARVSAIVLVQVHDNVRAVEVHASESASPGRMVAASATPSAARVQRVADADTGGAPATLAVRTVEMLRAMLVEAPDASPAIRRAAPVAPPSAVVQVNPDPVDDDADLRHAAALRSARTVSSPARWRL